MASRSGGRRAVASEVGIVTLAASALVSAGAAHADPSASITPVLGGLAAPRGIAFDGRGSMYVAESGVAGDGPAGLTQTGKVSKYRWGRTTPSWSTPFSSVYATEDPSAPPDVLGPEGLSATSSRCSAHRRDDRSSHGRYRWHHRSHSKSCSVSMIMSESTPGVAAASGGAVNAPQAGHLFKLNSATGAPTD